MSAKVEERVLSIAFDNKQFEAGVAQTLKTMAKLDAALLNLGKSSGLNHVAAEAKKVNFKTVNDAADKTTEKLRFKGAGDGLRDVDRESRRISFAPLSRALHIVESKIPFVAGHLRRMGEGVNFNGAARSADNFNRHLDFSQGARSLQGLENASNRVTFGPLSHSIDRIKTKFGVMQTAGVTAIATIAHKATEKIGAQVKKNTLDPIAQGYDEYQTKLKSIQTILANTEYAGTDLDDVKKALNELNKYSDQTIYNFGDMTKNISKFTAAGVNLKESVAAIKGLSNLAALSGSSANEAANAGVQLSQALASGKVGLQDYNSVVAAGIGGRAFQKSMIDSAVALGVIKKEMVGVDAKTKQLTINGQTFRDAMRGKPGEEPIFTGQVLSQALQNFTGDLSKAQLKARGFSEETAKAIIKQAKSAKASATEVKNLGQVFDIARETAGSGFAKTFELVFGDLGEAKKTFTTMSHYINGFLDKNAHARNEIIKGWRKLGGREELIGGFKNIAKALSSIIKPLKDAFHEVFPKTSAKNLYELTKQFREFTKNLKISPETADLLKRTLAGLFAVMHLGWTIAKNLARAILSLFGATMGNNGFLTLTASIGDFLVNLDKGIGKADSFKEFFKTLADVIAIPIHLLKDLASAARDFFAGDETKGSKELQDAFTAIKERAEPLLKVIEGVKRVFRGFAHALGDLGIPDFLGDIANGFANMLNKLAEMLTSNSVGQFSDILQAGLSGGILIALRQALSGDLLRHGLRFDATGGLLKNLMGTVHQFNGVLKGMQTELKARALLEIAAAIGVLAVSLFIFSKIEPDRLRPATEAVGAAALILVGAMGALAKVGGILSFVQLPIMAAGLIAVALAVDLLAVAIFAFSKIPADDLKKALYGVAGALAALGVGLKFISAGPSLLLIGPGLIAVAVALDILSVALRAIGKMSWEEIKKGLVGVGVSLYAIGIGLKRMGPSLILTGPGLIAVSIGLNFMAGALRGIGEIDNKVLVKGLLGIGAALQIISITMRSMPKTLILQAAAMVILSVSLRIMVSVLKGLAAISIGGILKAMVTLKVALTILKTALVGMQRSILGSIALRGVAASLLILAAALKIYSKLSLKTLAIGLAGITATIVAVGVAGGLAAPGLTALGYAMIPLGIGVASVSAGLLILAFALKLAGQEGVKAVTVLAAAAAGVIVLIPKLLVSLIDGVVQGVIAFSKAAPQLAQALYKILIVMLDTITKAAPKLGEAFLSVLFTLIHTVTVAAPQLLEAGAKLMLALLSGLDRHLPTVLVKAGSVIKAFLRGLRQQLPGILDEGAKTLVTFLDGIARNLGKVETAAFKVAIKFLQGITKNTPAFVAAGAKSIRTFLNSVAKELPGVLHSGGTLIVQFLKGIGNEVPRIIKAAHRTIRKFLAAIGDKEQIRKTVAAGFDAAVNFLDGITQGMKDSKGVERMLKAAFELGKELAKQILKGLGDIADDIMKKINPFDHRDDIEAADAANEEKFQDTMKKYGLHAKKAGEDVGDGFAKGVNKNAHKGRHAAERMAHGSIKGTRKVLDSHSPSRVFAEIGADIVAGLAIGLTGASSALNDGIVKPMRQLFRLTGDGEKFGKFISHGFLKGLEGSKDDIKTAFAGLKDRFRTENSKLRDSISKDQDKLGELMGADKRDEEAIKRLFNTIRRKKSLLAASKDAESGILKNLEPWRKALDAFAEDYEKTSVELENAQSALDDAVSARSDYAKAIADQYAELPSISDAIQNALDESDMTAEERAAKRREQARRDAVNQAAVYTQSLKDRLAAVIKFKATLEKLRAAGLDDDTYRKLLADGTADQSFAESLLAGGPGALAEIKKLSGSLATEAQGLGDTASHGLYDAGVKAAEGLVQGIKDHLADIQTVMNSVALEMVNYIKKALGIKSPSRVFAEVGRFSAKGLAIGLTESTQEVVRSAADLGDEAVNAMTQSLARMGNAVAAEISPDLTITPVLDLTQVKKDASKIADLTQIDPITTAAQAQQVSSETQATQAALVEAAAAAGPSVEFNQYNTSPEALDDVTIYRQTKNQFSQIKNALGVPSK